MGGSSSSRHDVPFYPAWWTRNKRRKLLDSFDAASGSTARFLRIYVAIYRVVESDFAFSIREIFFT